MMRAKARQPCSLASCAPFQLQKPRPDLDGFKPSRLVSRAAHTLAKRRNLNGGNDKNYGRSSFVIHSTFDIRASSFPRAACLINRDPVRPIEEFFRDHAD